MSEVESAIARVAKKLALAPENFRIAEITLILDLLGFAPTQHQLIDAHLSTVKNKKFEPSLFVAWVHGTRLHRKGELTVFEEGLKQKRNLTQAYMKRQGPKVKFLNKLTLSIDSSDSNDFITKRSRVKYLDSYRSMQQQSLELNTEVALKAQLKARKRLQENTESIREVVAKQMERIIHFDPDKTRCNRLEALLIGKFASVQWKETDLLTIVKPVWSQQALVTLDSSSGIDRSSTSSTFSQQSSPCTYVNRTSMGSSRIRTT